VTDRFSVQPCPFMQRNRRVRPQRPANEFNLELGHSDVIQAFQADTSSDWRSTNPRKDEMAEPDGPAIFILQKRREPEARSG
jgi:hypothetical protein